MIREVTRTYFYISPISRVTWQARTAHENSHDYFHCTWPPFLNFRLIHVVNHLLKVIDHFLPLWFAKFSCTHAKFCLSTDRSNSFLFRLSTRMSVDARHQLYIKFILLLSISRQIISALSPFRIANVCLSESTNFRETTYAFPSVFFKSLAPISEYFDVPKFFY